MDEDELSGVDPVQWNDVRRKVEVITAYLQIQPRTSAALMKAASELNLSVHQFRRLVRVWKASRDPGKLPGTRPSTPRTRRRNSLSATTKAIISSAISPQGGGTTLKRLEGVARQSG